MPMFATAFMNQSVNCLAANISTNQAAFSLGVLVTPKFYFPIILYAKISTFSNILSH